MGNTEPKKVENEIKNIKIDNYEILRILGNGIFSKVYHGIKLDTKTDMVIKLTTEKQFENELSILKSINQHNINNTSVLYDYKQLDNKHILIMKIFKGESLFKHITTINDDVIKWFCCIRDCVKELHKLNIFHRDIKPHNIVLNSNIPNLIDFGHSLTYKEDSVIKCDVGTPNYLCKYILSLSKYEHFSKRDILIVQDYWSLLLSFYFVYSKGKYLFRQSEIRILYKDIRNDNWILPKIIDTPFLKLVVDCLDTIKNNNIKLFVELINDFQ